MFKDNKYSRWYYAIVNMAKSRSISGYVEKHHIVPKCFGGKNGDNLVRLTAREHFICHRLLVYMTEGKAKSKMSFALQQFIRKNPNHDRTELLNSRSYEQIRRQIAAAFSELHKGKVFSQESRDKVSKANKGKKRTEQQKKVTGLASKKAWENNREKRLAAAQSPERNEKIRQCHIGRKHTKEHRDKHSKAISGTGNGRARQIKIISPSGETFDCHGSFQKFCKEHDLPFSSMCHLLHKTRTFPVGKTVGWSVDYID